MDDISEDIDVREHENVVCHSADIDVREYENVVCHLAA